MTDDPLIGKQLANFHIERLIGRGGMAQVYYGVDVKLERPVAVKVIDARYRADPTFAERFVREARAVATWRHENIIQIYYADDKDGFYYYAMECIDGLNLRELLFEYTAHGELMPHDHVLIIGRAIANALDYAHKQGIVHRDVKPSNVMIAEDDRVVLTDFGLALDVQEGTLGHAFGSARYIAPEQARDSASAVPQSDLYSLGVILYEMLTGVTPFDDPAPATVALQHLTLAPPFPREINPALNRETEAVLLKALGKSPDERYQTGNELIDALAEALQIVPPTPIQQLELPPPPADVHAPTPASSTLLKKNDLLGRQLDEYRLHALLGRGGMARVYRGLDVRLERWVAIKVIDTRYRTDADYVMRFEREAQAIAQLEHPHIVRLYRYGEAGGLLYMAMEYIDGANLGTVLASYREDQEFIAPEDARRIVREICTALDFAHQQGVIHRDIKPTNVMLDRQGRAYLTDFGLALLIEVGTRGEVLGSPHYVAPEQAISSAQAVPQSDLYAVGVILYEMFTGELPFQAAEPSEVAKLHMTEAPRPPRDLRPEISPELEAVILKALAKAPNDRYPDGATLADALDQASQTMPTETLPSSSATATHLSIPDRVTVHTADHPLPPIPAAIAQPVPQRTEGVTAPAPAAPGIPAALPVKRSIVYIGIAVGIIGTILLALLAVLPLLTRGIATTDTQMETREPTAAAETTLTPSRPGIIAPATLTPAPSPTGTPRPTATSAVTSAAEPAATSTEEPAATSTEEPAATSTEILPVPEKESPTQYDLLIAKRGEESLFVVNQTSEAFPLALLRLSSDKGFINGYEWGVDMLAADGCVAVWRDEEDPKAPPGLDCSAVGARLTRSKQDLLWKEGLYVYYEEQLVGFCEKDQKECAVSIPTQPSYLVVAAKRADEGLFVINWAPAAFSLASLRLGDGAGTVNGTEWGIRVLERDACVTIWKDKGEPQPPDGLTCGQVGENVTRSKKSEHFWRFTFNVYYDGEAIGTCEKERDICTFNIPIEK